jgi:Flp pilus assembly protein TadD
MRHCGEERVSRRVGRAGIVAAGWLLAMLVGPSLAATAVREPSADVHYERGAHALRLGDAETAVAELARAVEEAPEDVDALGLYSRALLLVKRPAEAAEVLERLRRADPMAPDLDLMEGLAYYRLREWERARDHLLVARKADPRNARVRLFLGVAYQELGEQEAAEREFREAVALDPALQSYVSYRLGLRAFHREQRREARQLFEEVIAQAPGSALADSAAQHLRGLGTERRIRAWGAAGFLYDTNVNLAGDGDVFAVSGETDYGGLLEAEIEALALSLDRLELRVGYHGFLSTHRNEKDLDIEANRGWARASYFFSEQISADMIYELDWAWADFDSFRRTNRFEPALRITPRADLFARVFYRIDDRAFFTENPNPALQRDGQVTQPGGDVYWFLPNSFGWGRNVARVGFRYRRENSDGNEYDSRGPIGVASLAVPLPSRTRFVMEGWYERRRFKNPSGFQPLVGDRSDKITQVRFLLQRSLSEHFWLEGEYRFVHWGSNVETYDFERHVSAVRIGYRY